MDLLRFSLIFLTVLITGNWAAVNVRSCNNHNNNSGTRSSDKTAGQLVTVGRCEKPPCKLKRNTKLNLEFQFTAPFSTTKLENKVEANISGFWLPFVGVDGTDACHQITNTETGKTGCPLETGKQYTYKNVINVLSIYPKINTEVKWSLEGRNGAAYCFQVLAKIV